MQGGAADDLLHVLSSKFPVVVRTGKGYVEACHEDVIMGCMAARMIDLIEADGNGPVDFVLCAGDDSMDELMLAKLHGSAARSRASSR